jgi:hypothetical protein
MLQEVPAIAHLTPTPSLASTPSSLAIQSTLVALARQQCLLAIVVDSSPRASFVQLNGSELHVPVSYVSELLYRYRDMYRIYIYTDTLVHLRIGKYRENRERKIIKLNLNT